MFWRSTDSSVDVSPVEKSLRPIALARVCPGVIEVKGGGAGSYLAVGAGDVYDAALIAGFLRGGDVPSCMSLGTAAAQLYVARRVDRFPIYEENAQLAQRVTTTTIKD
jgi:sugar/nucleoside kinase (ribokinase family)